MLYPLSYGSCAGHVVSRPHIFDSAPVAAPKPGRDVPLCPARTVCPGRAPRALPPYARVERASTTGAAAAERTIGVHVNALVTFPSGEPAELEGLTGAEQERLARFQHFNDEQMGYNHIQSTRPQTLAYGLTDSPIGQLAWIVEKFKEWTDAANDLPHEAVDRDTLLTDISIYWFTATGGQSSHLCYETAHDPAARAPKERGTVPTGVLVALTADIAIRRFAERDHNVVQWSESELGGHFFALEQPQLLVDDVRMFFRIVT
jgi:pimeloyl-ACP methyl ester carboxylesterase